MDENLNNGGTQYLYLSYGTDIPETRAIPAWFMRPSYVPDGVPMRFPAEVILAICWIDPNTKNEDVHAAVEKVLDHHHYFRDRDFGNHGKGEYGFIIDPREHARIHGQFTFKTYSLRSFCSRVHQILQYESGQSYVDSFIHYRYTLLGRTFPHDVFGTNRTTEFFEETLRFLNYPRVLRAALKKATDEGQTYEIRYLKWVMEHSKKELSTEYARQ